MLSPLRGCPPRRLRAKLTAKPATLLLLVSPLPAGAWVGDGRGAGGEGASRPPSDSPLRSHGPEISEIRGFRDQRRMGATRPGIRCPSHGAKDCTCCGRRNARPDPSAAAAFSSVTASSSAAAPSGLKSILLPNPGLTPRAPCFRPLRGLPRVAASVPKLTAEPLRLLLLVSPLPAGAWVEGGKGAGGERFPGVRPPRSFSEPARPPFPRPWRLRRSRRRLPCLSSGRGGWRRGRSRTSRCAGGA